MRRSCAMLLPSTEDEICRIRHSGLMNPNIFKLQKLLDQLDVANADDFAGEIPEDLVDSLVSFLEGKASERAQAELMVKKEFELKDKLLQETETMRDKVQKTKCDSRYLSEKCAAQDQDNKRQLMLEREVRANIAKETQLARRKTEKLAVDLKKAELEYERLMHLAKKGGK